jgi:hypothetical protein
MVVAMGLTAYDPAVGQTPARRAQQQKRLQRLAQAQKKAEDDRKAAEEKKKDDAKKAADLAKLEKALPAPAKLPTGPVTKNPAELAQMIDEAIEKKLVAEKIPPSPTCTDSEFLRRAYLDITGVIPPADKARTFIDSRDPDKRAKLIDELLDSSNFGRHQADIWASLIIQKTSDNRRVDFTPFREWLAAQFNQNKPWSETVSDMVAATGDYEKVPAAAFYMSNNTVDKMTDQVSKLFLGVSIQCAQCHDHKFEDWKQKEYWSFTQFFMKVSIGGGAGAKIGGDAMVNETGRINRKKSPLPEAAMNLPATFLRDGFAKLNPSSPYRPKLAAWLTNEKNPYFAKAMVNRVWSQLFGTGFCNPTDMGPNETPSHPELLANLAHQFGGGGFDLKNLVRAVCLSQTYQRSSKAIAGNEKDATNFSHMAVKIMSPEMLFDSTMAVTGGPAAGPAGRGQRAQKAQKPKVTKGVPPNRRDQFVNFFLAGADSTNNTEYEAGIPQALKLMNSRQMTNPAAVRTILGFRPVKKDAIEKLYLLTLSRRPTADEVTRMSDFINKSPVGLEGYADLLWALLNCSEFTMVR